MGREEHRAAAVCTVHQSLNKTQRWTGVSLRSLSLSRDIHLHLPRTSELLVIQPSDPDQDLCLQPLILGDWTAGTHQPSDRQLPDGRCWDSSALKLLGWLLGIKLCPAPVGPVSFEPGLVYMHFSFFPPRIYMFFPHLSLCL